MNLPAQIQNRKSLYILLIAFTFLIKLSLAFYFSYLSDCRNPEISIGHLAKSTGDTFAYIGSIDNFVKDGTFYFWNGVRNVYAGRMPHYGSLYFLFLMFFDKPLASDLTVLIQIAFDAIATVYFAKLCRDVLNRRAGFWLGYVLYLLSFNYFANVLLLAPESFAFSFIVLFLYAFHRWWSRKNESAIWAANIFLTLAFVLKPYFAPTYLVFLAIYLYRENLLSVSRFKPLFTKLVLLGLPAFLLLAPWFIRNVAFLGQPIATQEGYLAGYNFTEPDLAFKRFSAGWGGDIVWWDAGSPACYFKLNPPFPCTFTLPPYSMTSGYSLQDIEDVRTDYLAYQKEPSPELEKIVVSKFDRLTDIYKGERPFMFYVGSNFIRLRTLLWHTSNYNLPIHSSNPCFEPYQLSFKVTQSIIYHLGLALGLAGVIWLTFKRKISLIFLFAPLSVGFLIAFYFRFAEARYLSHIYPVLLLGLTLVFFLLYSFIKNLLVDEGVDSSTNLD